jgi:peptide/nickel transport system permease protein
MTAVLPISAEPAALPQEEARPGRWRRMPTKAKVGAVLLGLFVLAGVIGPLVAPYDPSFQNASPALSLHAPYGAHLLGTTQSGQDVLSQLLTGIRLTLELAFFVGLVATVLSVLVGVTSAFLGGVWDEVLSLLTNVFLVIPALPLLIVLLGYWQSKGQTATILVLSLLSWPWGARVVRAQTMAIRNRDFISAARETGEKTWRIIGYEIVPNEVSLIAASFVNTVLYAIGASVALAFIGVTNLNSWSLGTMLYWAQSQQALQLGAWWWFVPPGLAVALIGMGLVLLNTGIDELGNPRLRDAASASRIAGRWLPPANPTPVLSDVSRRRGRLAGFLHSFSRSSLLDETEGGRAR